MSSGLVKEHTFEMLDYGNAVLAEFTVYGYDNGTDFEWVLDTLYDFDQNIEVKMTDLSERDQKEITEKLMELAASSAWSAWNAGVEADEEAYADRMRDE